MSVVEAVEVGHDAHARPVTAKLVAGGTVQALTQASYDALGRPDCAATRMNPAAFASLPSSACSLGAQGGHGPDRISKNVYDSAGQVIQVKSAVGTALEAADVTTTYTANGKAATVADGENNKTSYEYDGHDRLSKTYYPSPTKGAGTSNGADYEQLGYDAAGNVTSRRLRDGNSVGYSYDALGRLVSKTRPNSEGNAAYGYDNLGRMTSNTDLGKTLTFTWDALGRRTSEINRWGTVSSAWDAAGRRTRLTHPDGFWVDYDHLVTGETSAVRENGAASGVGVLATYTYDDLGRRTSLTRGNGTVKSYAYDAASRLSSLGENLTGTSADLTQSFTYNPASQIATATRSNDAYAWSSHYNLTRNYGSNGLNQYTASGPVTPTYDARGNLTSAGATTYAYNSDNLLTHRNGADFANYDGLMRLSRIGSAGQPATKFNYDGVDLIGEYDGAVAGVSLLRRYVHGPGADEPLVWYEGSGTNDRRFLHSDERGSIIATSNSAGALLSTNSYDENGIPGSGNSGRFQYTGQAWLPELGMYYYKARLYSPTLGRFLQTDPIGYGDGMNMYAYVGGDPVNRRDPSGLQAEEEQEIVVTGKRLRTNSSTPGGSVALMKAEGGWGFRRYFNNEGFTGGGGGGEADAVKLGKMCKGVAEFTAVGGAQAMDKGALAAFGIMPVTGSVAVDPNQFGIPYGGTAAFNEAAQRRFVPIARQIGIISPAAAALSAEYGGPTSSFFPIGDVGDKNVRSGHVLRLDLYRFPTEDQARGFGRRTLPVIITNVPLNTPCPPGTTEV